jgi:hypothetical protein
LARYHSPDSGNDFERFNGSIGREEKPLDEYRQLRLASVVHHFIEICASDTYVLVFASGCDLEVFEAKRDRRLQRERRILVCQY